MKAIVFEQYGGPEVLKLRELDTPTPKAHEVLIKVHATTVSRAESMMRQGLPVWGRMIIGLFKPRKYVRILGTEIAGEIVSVGSKVKRFQEGDQIYGFTGFTLGANAEYNCMPEYGSLALKPKNKTYEEAAAAVDGGTTAYFFLKEKIQVQPGQKVLINGASGSIGTYAVQLARHLGAEVTGVCSGRNVELVKSLGTHKVIDYTQQDFTKMEEKYDIIFDTVNKSPFTRCKRVLKPNGIYIPTSELINLVHHFWTWLKWKLPFPTSGKRVITGMSVEKNEALVYIRELIEKDKLEIIIDKRFPLEEIAEAHKYVDTGRKRGNVVINVSPEK